MEKLPGSFENKAISKGMTFFLITFLFLIFEFIPLSMAAEAEIPSEWMVKATFLYNFAQFVEWPEDAFKSPDAPLNLCILGKDPFGEAITAIKDKFVRRRPLLIRYCKDTREVEGCHILFISKPKEGDGVCPLPELKKKPWLTVSDAKGFAADGGMIRLFRMGKKIRFEINPAAAKRSCLKISSRLLKLAKIVKETPAKEEEP